MPTLPRLDLTKLDLSQFELPKLPKVELPAVDVDRLGELARDAAYAGIGLATVAAQRIDARRRELQTEVTARVRQLVDAVA
ncbi:MAG: hypothetical protein ACRDZZ_07725 [Ilumatobacteraceae bacterium]